jgi:RNA polymerase sigma-70 factor, ECF subfamily
MGKATTMEESEPIRQFADRLLAAQTRLYSYILTLLPFPDQANDVLQETNLTLWRESDKFSLGTNFEAWACRVAYFQILTHRRKSHREPIVFGDAFLEGLAEQTMPAEGGIEEESLLLRQCLEMLAARERKLIHKRYDAGESVKAIAAELDQPPNMVAVALFRIRQALMKCVREKLSQRDRG